MGSDYSSKRRRFDFGGLSSLMIQEPNNDRLLFLLGPMDRDPEAQWSLGEFYSHADSHNDLLAAEWYRKAANQGHPAAAVRYAVFCFEGRGGVVMDHHLGKRLLLYGAKMGNSEGLRLLAVNNSFLGGWDENVKPLLCRAAELGDQTALAHLLFRYPQEYKQTKPIMDAEAIYALGTLSEEANSISQSYKYYETALRYGYGRAAYPLANLSCRSSDYKKAVAYLERGALLGGAESQNRLGYMYSTGRGCKQDKKTACTWYKKAAEQGYVMAYYNLGTMYWHGSGVTQSYPEAFRLYQIAANQSHNRSMYKLSLHYRDGLGCNVSHFWHVYWCVRGATEDSVACQNMLMDIAENGLPHVLHDIKGVEEWKPELP